MKPLLEVEDLCVDLVSGKHWRRVVDGVSFCIRQGETFCLVGESGSGKSVTALSILGLLTRDFHRHPRGRVTLHEGCEQDSTKCELLGANDTLLRHVRGRRIGMIFQEATTCLNPVMTIGEQLDETLRLHRPNLTASQRLRRLMATLEEVQFGDAARRLRDYPHCLSGGQQQRVMIAMSLICEPQLLIADEPTTALDVSVQAGILALLHTLQQQRNMGILFITHDFGVVAQIADTVAVMWQGKLVEQGRANQVLRAASHAYTRKLIAALPERLTRPVATAAPAVSGSASSGLLEVEALSVHFPIRQGLLRRTVDQFRAVEKVSLQLGGGEVLALVGESGCGKTTLGRAILRLIEPSGGSIRLAGQDITGLSRRRLQPLRRQMQVVFQDPGASLNPRLTILSSLLEPMRVHGIGNNDIERRRYASEWLERVEMPADSLRCYPHEFSGGQRQRLAIARALVLRPCFILCDEITSALDVSVQAGLLQLLRRLVDEQGLALLFITHNMAVVRYLADRIAVMHAGKLLEYGPLGSVLEAPTHEYTRRLLAAIPQLDTVLQRRFGD